MNSKATTVVKKKERSKEAIAIGLRIKEARSDKDMSQLDLSTRIDVTRATVGQWEIGNNSPNIAKTIEIAALCGVSPEWLAFGTKPGAERIVYRNPERDNIHWVNEIQYGKNLTNEKVVSNFGLPFEYLSRGLNTDPENTVLLTINSHAVEPEYEYDDKVFVDRTDNRPSPAGVFAYWDGVGMNFAKLQVAPGKGAPKVKISAKGQKDVTMPLEDLEIIGRVKGRIQRG